MKRKSLRLRISDYRRKWGMFGLIFPILGFLVAVAILLVCLKYGAGFDVLAWLISTKAIPIYIILFALLTGLISVYCGA